MNVHDASELFCLATVLSCFVAYLRLVRCDHG